MSWLILYKANNVKKSVCFVVEALIQKQHLRIIPSPLKSNFVDFFESIAFILLSDIDWIVDWNGRSDFIL